MFDPLNGPSDHYRGPAVGDSTEHGDTWHVAVAKINAGFAAVKDAFENGFRHIVEAIDSEAREGLAAAREEITKLKEIVEALHNRIDAITAPGVPMLTEAQPPSEETTAERDAAADPDGKPATGGTPGLDDPAT